MSREAPVTQWVFTRQLADDEDAWAWLNRQFETHAYSYLVGQVEQAPTTGQLHIQGYAQMAKRMRLPGMKALDSEAHWEHCKAPAEARAYAMKEDTRVRGPWEFGECRTAGRKTTLQDVCALVLEGKSDYDISRVAPEQFVRHFKGISALRVAAKIPGERRTWAPELWVVWGPSGSGKSWFAQMNVGRRGDRYWKMQGNKWWDGYCGRGHRGAGRLQGQLDDPGGLPAPSGPLPTGRGDRREGPTPMLAKRIVITSNTHPSTWYSGDTAAR
ncbi:REP [Rodent stool-associated circular genome virus]|uniref:REP n=1 Tax=Rodent stool-associated circular genome virus TaxID=1074214 RepID=G1C9H2_9VIRU|nr:REP [Rodent stool-associated circular genome virus]